MDNIKNVREIPDVIESIDCFLKKYNITTGDILRCRLLAEEVILTYRDKFGCDCFSFDLAQHSGKLSVSLAFQANSYDVFNEGDDIIIRNLTKGMFCRYSWEYKNGENRVCFEFDTTRTMFDNLLYLIKFVKDEKYRFSAACLIQLISILLCVIIPVLSARLISNYALSDLEAIITTALMLFGVRAVNNFLYYLSNRLHNAAFNKIRHAIEMELANALMNMNVDSIEKHGTGMIIQRMTGDSLSLAYGTEKLMSQISDVINYLGIFAAIFILSPEIFALKLVGTAILIAIEARKSKVHNANERAYRIQNDRFSDIVGEMVRGSKDIKLLHSEKHFIQTLEQVMEKTNNARTHLWNTSQNYSLVSNETGKILDLSFYLALALCMSLGRLKPTDAIVLFNYSNNLTGISTFIGDFLDYLKGLALSSERVYQLINNREFVKEVFGKKHPDNFLGDIEFRDVTFAYDSNDPSQKPVPVLNGLNIKIHAGETVAFVGKSGCGKTTALNLISKLYTPVSGTVLLDGVDINQLDKETIRGNIAVVSQNPYVFNMSIRENLHLIKPDLTEEEMISVCQDACIHDEIMQFPKGYDTVLGEGGTMISGGQRQRLALARSILQNNRIVLFDEATSALDNLTQARIQETINRFGHQRTVVIVAHRLSTIKMCDRIFYFSNGRVLAQGTHAELMETCPDYRKLYMNE